MNMFAETGRLMPEIGRTVYCLDFFDTNTDTLIMIQIFNYTDTDTFTTKGQHIICIVYKRKFPFLRIKCSQTVEFYSY